MKNEGERDFLICALSCLSHLLDVVLRTVGGILQLLNVFFYIFSLLYVFMSYYMSFESFWICMGADRKSVV